MAVAKATNSSAMFVPIAGFVLCQKLFVQMDTGATLCYLGMRVAFGLELAPGEECVWVLRVGRRHFCSGGGEVRPLHERRMRRCRARFHVEALQQGPKQLRDQRCVSRLHALWQAQGNGAVGWRRPPGAARATKGMMRLPVTGFISAVRITRGTCRESPEPRDSASATVAQLASGNVWRPHCSGVSNLGGPATA